MVTQTLLEANSSATDASSYNTGSITPSANKLILISVFADYTVTSSPAPTVTGCGLTWVKVID